MPERSNYYNHVRQLLFSIARYRDPGRHRVARDSLKHLLATARIATRPVRGFLYAAHTVHDRRNGHTRPFRDEARLRNSRGSVRDLLRLGVPGVQDRADRRCGVRRDRDRESELGKAAPRPVLRGADHLLTTTTGNRSLVIGLW